MASSGSGSGSGLSAQTKHLLVAGAVAVAGALSYWAYSAWSAKKAEAAAAAAAAKKLPFGQKQLQRFHRAFKRLDRDGNGSLDEHEVRHLAKLLYIPSDAELKAAVARFDVNGDQRVSFDEFVTRLTTVSDGDAKHKPSKIDLSEHDMRELKLQFDALDANGDGFISGAECVALARDAYVPTAETVALIMSQLDIDHSKTVSLEEFLHFMSNAMAKAKADGQFRSVQAMVADIEAAEKREAKAAGK